jgi:hypothetical protein
MRQLEIQLVGLEIENLLQVRVKTSGTDSDSNASVDSRKRRAGGNGPKRKESRQKN